MTAPGRCPGELADMGKDLSGHGGIDDACPGRRGGDDRQGATALGAVFYVDSEHPYEQPGLRLMRAGAEGWGASP